MVVAEARGTVRAHVARQDRVRDLHQLDQHERVDRAAEVVVDAEVERARTEAVVVGERYGVRITSIVPASERVRRLGGEVIS